MGVNRHQTMATLFTYDPPEVDQEGVAKGKGRTEAKAPRGSVWGGGVPVLTGAGIWRGVCAPSPDNFSIFELKKASFFGTFWD